MSASTPSHNFVQRLLSESGSAPKESLACDHIPSKDRWSDLLHSDKEPVPAAIVSLFERQAMLDRPPLETSMIIDIIQRDDNYWSTVGRPRFDTGQEVEWWFLHLVKRDAANDIGEEEADWVDFTLSARRLFARLSAEASRMFDYADALAAYERDFDVASPSASQEAFKDYMDFGSTMIDWQLRVRDPSSPWDPDRTDFGCDALFSRLGDGFAQNAWWIFPAEALAFSAELPSLQHSSYLWDVAGLFKYWKKRGRPELRNADHVEQFLCAFLLRLSKLTKGGTGRGPSRLGGRIPASIVNADLSVRSFCQRLNSGGAQSTFARMLSLYDHRLRSCGPLDPVQFRTDLAAKTQQFASHTRRLAMERLKAAKDRTGK